MPIHDDARALIAKINKEHGPGAVLLGSQMKVDKRFTSGSLSIDVALGGGWPANQPIEIIGRESHGKTAVTLKTLAANMALDPEFTALWVAAEHYDTDQAAALGVDNDRVLVYSTQSMEDAYETMLTFAESKSVDSIVLDSYPALIADEEAEKDMDEAVMALGARLTGKFFRKYGNAGARSHLENERPLLGPIFINQFRDAIGQFSPRGTPKTTPGGNAKNYAFYVRAEVVRDEYLVEKLPGKDLKVNVGQKIKVTTIKNKSAPPRQVASVDFYFMDAPISGFKRGEYDGVKEILVNGLLYDVLQRKGSYFQYDNGVYDENGKPVYRWQGKDPMLAALREDVDLYEAVSGEVMRRVADPSYKNDITEGDVEAAETAGTKKVSRRTKAA